MSLNYTVIITQRAFDEVAKSYDWIAAENPPAAKQWQSELLAAIDKLSEFPERCPIVSAPWARSKSLRQLIYGKKRGHHRILFEISRRTVYIIHIIHSARDKP